MEITDGTVKWKVKTKTNKEYVDEKTGEINNRINGIDNKVNVVDGKVNECEKKQTLKTVNATVNRDFVDNFSCYQIGHAVQVSISLKKIQLGSPITLVSGLPKPMCALLFEESIHGNQGKTVRISLWDNGILKLWYLDSAEIGVGKEFQTFFTYLTEDV